MVKKQLYITEEQAKYIEEYAKQYGFSEALIFRIILNKIMKSNEPLIN